MSWRSAHAPVRVEVCAAVREKTSFAIIYIALRVRGCGRPETGRRMRVLSPSAGSHGRPSSLR